MRRWLTDKLLGVVETASQDPEVRAALVEARIRACQALVRRAQSKLSAATRDSNARKVAYWSAVVGRRLRRVARLKLRRDALLEAATKGR